MVRVHLRSLKLSGHLHCPDLSDLLAFSIITSSFDDSSFQHASIDFHFLTFKLTFCSCLSSKLFATEVNQLEVTI